MVVHKLSVTFAEAPAQRRAPPLPGRYIYIFGSSEGTDVFGKRGNEESIRISKGNKPRTAPSPSPPPLPPPQTSERAWQRDSQHARHASQIAHEVLVGLLGVPLLPLFASLHLGEQRLPVGLVRLDDVLQLLHEEQLQHALVRVQVGQLEQLPLQDVVVPDGEEQTLMVPADGVGTPEGHDSHSR